MRNNDRMGTLNKIINAQGSLCPSCGVPNKCSMEMGKSASLCWCMSVSIVPSVPLGVEQCLCRKCLLDEEKPLDTTLNLA